MIEIVKGDITTLEVDCIVNAANTRLSRGAGVCGAIFKAAGEGLQEFLWENYDGCPTGEARISSGFNCLAKHIIHTVAPIWMGGTQNEPHLLRSCYEHTLQLALHHQIQSIAFPALGCGIYQYPIESATKIALNVALNHGKEHQTRIVFCCFSESIYESYQRLSVDE